MGTYYSIRSNQYARISQDSYGDYLRAKERYKSMGEVKDIDISISLEKYIKMCQLATFMDDAAVIAVIFQALAVEAYVNLAGMYIIGEKEYYKKHEKSSTFSKMCIIERALGKKFSDELKGKISALLVKRNELVHQKPRSFTIGITEYNYDDKTENFSDIEKFFDDFKYATENIDENMLIYSLLQKELTAIRNSGRELIDEIQSKYILDGET